MKDQARLRNMAVACLTILVLGVPGLSNAKDKSDSSRLIIFGDSLSDAGNFYLATGQFAPVPDENGPVAFQPIPDAPYKHRGKFRFSDGPTWVEQLARKLHAKKSAKPALKKPGKHTNYAYGRARARTDADSFPYFDLEEQRTQFLTDFGWVAPADATYVIWIGGNDVRDALQDFLMTGGVNPVPSLIILNEALMAINDHISGLSAYGAQNFLVLNVPDLAITPAISGFGPEAQGAATFISSSFNEGFPPFVDGLDATLDGLEAALGVQIARLDVFTLLNTVVATPRAFGFKNVTEPCLTIDGTTIGVSFKDLLCNKPKRYLFVDEVHPTTRGHRVLARAAEDLLDNDDDDHHKKRHHDKGRHHDDDDD